MLSSFLPGQEAGNVNFVVDQGFGECVLSPRTAPPPPGAAPTYCAQPWPRSMVVGSLDRNA